MKSLLIAVNAKYIHSNPAVFGLMDYCEESKMNISVREFTINQDINYICSEIYKEKPDIMAFSCYIWNIGLIMKIADDMHKILPDADIWLGGPEVSYDSEKILEKHSNLKGIMIGEGEETFKELMEKYSMEKKVSEISLEEVRGISYQARSGVMTTGVREPVNMDKLKFIYEGRMDYFENKIIYYESSRGCPFSCSYCLSSIEKSVRFRNLDLVKREMLFFLEKNVPQVKFVDRTFNCSHSRTKEILSFLYKHDNGITNFHFEIAGDLLDEEELDIIKSLRPGLIQFETGIQSTNPKTIHAIDRRIDFNVLSGIVKKINEGENVHQHLDLIAGLPYEDYLTFQKSFNDVYDLRPEQLQLGFLKVLKGSSMYWNADRYGIVYSTQAPYQVLYTRWMGYQELLYIKNVEEVVEIYYNSGQYRHTIRLLENCFDSPFIMFKALSDYYEENHLFEMKHSRNTRYRILLDFIYSVTDNKNAHIFEQILLLDLYLRENMKTKPEFSIDPHVKRGDMKKLYLEIPMKENVHIEPFDVDVEKICNIEFQKLDVRVSVKGEDLSNGNTPVRYFVFDYGKRNPLNYEAEVSVLNVIGE